MHCSKCCTQKIMASLSCSFVADLPPLTETQLEKLHTWIQKSCMTGDVHLNRDGSMKLVCTRSKAVDKRQHQRTLRTNLLNWGVELVSRQADWLRLVDERDVGVSGEADEAARNALDSTGEDMEMAETLTEPRNETNTAMTAPALSRCATKFSLGLPLPRSLLTDPAFFVAAR